MIRLELRGPPQSRHEPHYQIVPAGPGRLRVHTYPDKRTARGLEAWHDEWLKQGRPRLEGPVVITIDINRERPPSHLLRSGGLSADGRRQLVPSSPDVDNVAKLVLDALKGHAFADDAKVAGLRVGKAWAGRSVTLVMIEPLDQGGPLE